MLFAGWLGGWLACLPVLSCLIRRFCSTSLSFIILIIITASMLNEICVYFIVVVVVVLVVVVVVAASFLSVQLVSPLCLPNFC